MVVVSVVVVVNVESNVGGAVAVGVVADGRAVSVVRVGVGVVVDDEVSSVVIVEVGVEARA